MRNVSILIKHLEGLPDSNERNEILAPLKRGEFPDRLEQKLRNLCEPLANHAPGDKSGDAAYEVLLWCARAYPKNKDDIFTTGRLFDNSELEGSPLSPYSPLRKVLPENIIYLSTGHCFEKSEGGLKKYVVMSGFSELKNPYTGVIYSERDKRRISEFTGIPLHHEKERPASELDELSQQLLVNLWFDEIDEELRYVIERGCPPARVLFREEVTVAGYSQVVGHFIRNLELIEDSIIVLSENLPDVATHRWVLYSLWRDMLKHDPSLVICREFLANLNSMKYLFIKKTIMLGELAETYARVSALPVDSRFFLIKLILLFDKNSIAADRLMGSYRSRRIALSMLVNQALNINLEPKEKNRNNFIEFMLICAGKDAQLLMSTLRLRNVFDQPENLQQFYAGYAISPHSRDNAFYYLRWAKATEPGNAASVIGKYTQLIKAIGWYEFYTLNREEREEGRILVNNNPALIPAHFPTFKMYKNMEAEIRDLLNEPSVKKMLEEGSLLRYYNFDNPGGNLYFHRASFEQRKFILSTPISVLEKIITCIPTDKTLLRDFPSDGVSYSGVKAATEFLLKTHTDIRERFIEYILAFRRRKGQTGDFHKKMNKEEYDEMVTVYRNLKRQHAVLRVLGKMLNFLRNHGIPRDMLEVEALFRTVDQRAMAYLNDPHPGFLFRDIEKKIAGMRSLYLVNALKRLIAMVRDYEVENIPIKPDEIMLMLPGGSIRAVAVGSDIPSLRASSASRWPSTFLNRANATHQGDSERRPLSGFRI